MCALADDVGWGDVAGTGHCHNRRVQLMLGELMIIMTFFICIYFGLWLVYSIMLIYIFCKCSSHALDVVLWRMGPVQMHRQP